jgi:hypothetical protein
MAKVILDVGTVRGATSVLFPIGHDKAEVKSSRRKERPSDLDVVATGQLIESLILFDEVLVPDLDGRNESISALVRPLGEAVSLLPVSASIAEDIKASAREWLAYIPNLSDMTTLAPGSDVLQSTPWWMPFSVERRGEIPIWTTGSTDYLVLHAFGVRRKYSDEVRAFLDLARSDRMSHRKIDKAARGRGQLEKALSRRGLPKMPGTRGT